MILAKLLETKRKMWEKRFTNIRQIDFYTGFGNSNEYSLGCLISSGNTLSQATDAKIYKKLADQICSLNFNLTQFAEIQINLNDL